MSTIKLIVGLGNPGKEYADTRHNAGVWFLDALCRSHRCELKPESRFHGATARLQLEGQDLRLLRPDTFMNRSGKAVSALANFYRITPEQILVAHDELDLPAGVARFKQGGGAGGNNGLKDIIQCLSNNKQFKRLRIGIEHPGSADKVTGHVLSKPSVDDRRRIDDIIDDAIRALPLAVSGDWEKAMTQLHSIQY